MQEYLNKIAHRKKILFLFVAFSIVLIGLLVRLIYLMIWQGEYYSGKAVAHIVSFKSWPLTSMFL